MALFRTRGTGNGEDLAEAIRAGDDAGAAKLAADLGIPGWLLTHGNLGPRGSVPIGVAAGALAIIAASSAPGGGAVAATARQHRVDDPQVLDLVAEAVESAAIPGRPQA